MADEIIYGLNPVLSSLEGKRRPRLVLISETLTSDKVRKLCEQKGVRYQLKDRRELDRLFRGTNHQGVIAYVEPFHYLELRDLMVREETNPQSLLVVLDGIEDPVNFGSLLRSSSCFGVSAVIIGQNRQVQVTPTVIKLSTGASEYIDVCRVVNVASSLSVLKKHGYWIVAADGSGTLLYDEVDYGGKIALVVGSEGRGVSRRVLAESDFVARIPIDGRVTSLNAAVAGAIFLSAAASSRLKKAD